MDAILIIVGTCLTILGAKRRDETGHRTGGGIALMTSGIVATAIGATMFVILFTVGWLMAQKG
jgi:hypothetical protein